jgi:Resolvase, N terminal domain
MEPQESTETTTGRKGQIWKLFAYFLGLYLVTFAANQVVIRYKDMAQAEGLVRIGSMIARPPSSGTCPDRAPPCCRPRWRAFAGGFLGRGDGMAKRLRVGLYARVSTHDQQTLPLQLEAMRAYVAQRGWIVVTEVRDVSSGALQRP